MLSEEVKKQLTDLLAPLLQKFFKFLNYPEVEEYIKVFYVDSDRGCILSIGSSLGYVLEQRIRSEFGVLDGIRKKDLNFLLTQQPLPPLGSFGVKIRLAHAMGIVDLETRNALSAIGAMRNDQAHSFMGKKLTEASVNKLVQKMRSKDAERIRLMAKGWSEEILKNKDDFLSEGYSIDKITSTPRLLLMSVCFHLVLAIMSPSKSS